MCTGETWIYWTANELKSMTAKDLNNFNRPVFFCLWIIHIFNTTHNLTTRDYQGICLLHQRLCAKWTPLITTSRFIPGQDSSCPVTVVFNKLLQALLFSYFHPTKVKSITQIILCVDKRRLKIFVGILSKFSISSVFFRHFRNNFLNHTTYSKKHGFYLPQNWY